MARADKPERLFIVNPIDINDPFIQLNLVNLFDQDTDEDVRNIEFRMKKIKRAKRMAFIRTVIFPVEAALMYLLMPKDDYNYTVQSQKINWGLLRGKLSIEQFEERYFNLATSQRGNYGL